ncbi:MAG: hypothetical protein WCP21_13780, partial [Armatimonadota bacterium]
MTATLAIAHAADTPAVALSEQQVGRYQAAVQKTLASLRVKVCAFTVSDTLLFLGYENSNEQESDVFILATVLNLLRPLASTDDQIIRAASYAQGRKLVEVSATRDDVQSAYDGQLRDGEEGKVRQLVATAVAEAGLASAPLSTPAITPVTPPIVPAAKSVSLPVTSEEELADRLLQALAQAKLENIAIARDGRGGWIMGFENRTYRSDMDAMAAALRIIADTLPTAPLLLQVKRDDVPVCQMGLNLADCVAAQGQTLAPAELAQRWQVASNGLD